MPSQRDDDRDRGLYPKWEVKRINDTDPPKHPNCDVFVLDWEHDRYAVAAMVAYANACEVDYPLLAKEIRQKVNSHFAKRFAKNEPVGLSLSPDCRHPDMCGTKMRDGTFRCRPCRDVHVSQFKK